MFKPMSRRCTLIKLPLLGLFCFFVIINWTERAHGMISRSRIAIRLATKGKSWVLPPHPMNLSHPIGRKKVFPADSTFNTSPDSSLKLSSPGSIAKDLGLPLEDFEIYNPEQDSYFTWLAYGFRLDSNMKDHFDLKKMLKIMETFRNIGLDPHSPNHFGMNIASCLALSLNAHHVTPLMPNSQPINEEATRTLLLFIVSEWGVNPHLEDQRKRTAMKWLAEYDAEFANEVQEAYQKYLLP